MKAQSWRGGRSGSLAPGSRRYQAMNWRRISGRLPLGARRPNRVVAEALKNDLPRADAEGPVRITDEWAGIAADAT